MTVHKQKKWVRHSPEQMFRLVADVERYPEFLPWCVASRIHSHEQDEASHTTVADLMVSFKGIRESFRSEVNGNSISNRIDVRYLRGPFERLENLWLFNRNIDGTCTVDFHIDFTFRSRVLQMLIGTMFEHVVETMVDAFEERADALYSGFKS